MRNLVPAVAAAALLTFAAASSARGQISAPPFDAPLAVYLDCRTGCDTELIRTEITYVNWVRVREAADVHVLLTSQGAGAGGQLFTIAYLGQRALAGRGDTLTYSADPTTTDDERRRGLTQRLAMGLMQFVARTPTADALRISPAPAEAGRATPGQSTPAYDPWNAWVFGINLGGSTDGEALYRSHRINGGLSANRVTEAWKTNFRFNMSYRDSRSTVQEFDDNGVVIDEETYRNLQRNWNANLEQVKSITGHLSLGLFVFVESNTFRNQRLHTTVIPALEYNIFPYSESTRRRLTIATGAGADAFRYADTTIFDKMRETLPLHYLQAEYSTRQPWGSTFVRGEHRTYLSDMSKRATELSADLNVRIFRGFSVNVGGSYNWIHDQIYLVKGGGQDPVDVLLRRRALLTGFEYDFRVGFNYSFGSIFNNVVNPRF